MSRPSMLRACTSSPSLARNSDTLCPPEPLNSFTSWWKRTRYFPSHFCRRELYVTVVLEPRRGCVYDPSQNRTLQDVRTRRDCGIDWTSLVLLQCCYGRCPSPKRGGAFYLMILPLGGNNVDRIWRGGEAYALSGLDENVTFMFCLR